MAIAYFGMRGRGDRLRWPPISLSTPLAVTWREVALLQGMVALGTISGFRFVLGEWYKSDDEGGVIQIAIGPQCAPVRVNRRIGLQLEDAWVRKK